ncbi:MAG: flagellar biosynthesis regulator FlaF [Phenylobacterium sp.]|jgi:flagellar protein FlaF|uniref:flagellar biosynthesis regulator FlaF n=1 Tax=unclassified Phenylobacterium TaxID=2640670 RepID=UPI0008BAC81A|nr:MULTISPECIES: flagellar biosynthesis regulator FlaF [unclassified Phenylobacterium]MBJ7409260.1 flagellar biosynthesis regulator FlaF [Phenylobacterium sp.]OHB30353.1 MAG: flagellar biosynthesis regulator FlhF [Phenylobacterium sp. RIFCSPHIGHO2_01_FULL_69_31]
MSLQAYQQAATRAENPRDMEYRLFAQVTRALMEAAALDRTEVGKRVDALDWNRRMWATLGTDCANPQNGLPAPLRASFISLSIWVSKHTTLVIRNQEEIEPLIEINRMIMQGLASQGSQAAA